MNRLTILVVLPLLAISAGCADVGSLDAMQQRVIRDADPDQVLAAAVVLLQRDFGRAKAVRSARRAEAGPYEYTTERESGTARDLYRGRSTMRRKAVFSVGRRGGQTVARLRIDVERRDTERQAVRHPRGHRLSDTPGQETPIYADAATTLEQNTVWTRVRRDRRLERALLDELCEQFARLSAGSESPATAESPDDAPSQSAPAAEPPN